MFEKRTGSITVFLSLIFMVVGSLLFTFLEVGRYHALDMEAELVSQSITESVFAEYVVPAYEKYHLFLMDSGYGSRQMSLSKVNERMQKLGQENLSPDVSGFRKFLNLLQMNVVDSTVAQYELATDDSFYVLAEQMIQVAKQELGLDVLKIAQSASETKASIEQGHEANQYIDNAMDTIEHAGEDAEEAEEEAETAREVGEPVKEPVEDPENPMEDVKSAQDSPLLAQVLPEEAKISAKALHGNDSVLNRARNQGNYGVDYSVSAGNKALLLHYYQKYLSSYRTEFEMPHALQYEQEYLLSGKKSDEKNLKGMAERLIALREGMNFTYLLTDSARRAEAYSLALAIATAAGIPEAASGIEMGILASWAYAESIVEVRTLFFGEKIAAVKTGESWSVELYDIGIALTDHSCRAKNVGAGMTYQQFLYAFLLAVPTNTLVRRAADLLERNIRLNKGYEQICLDNMYTAAKIQHTFAANQLFLSFVTLVDVSDTSYTFQKENDFSYL